MVVKEITYQVSRTINTGNYESAKVDIAMTASIDEDENWKNEYSKLKAMVHARIVEEVKEILETNIRQMVKDQL